MTERLGKDALLSLDQLKRFYGSMWQLHADACDAECKAGVEAAKGSARATYLFFVRYAAFNGYAGPLVARLASTIGLSRDVFRADSVARDISDKDMEIAARVFFATIDEYRDLRQQGRTHRTMAQATVEAAAQHAGLTTAERAELSALPAAYSEIVEAYSRGYQGVVGDPEAIVRALGFHLASEIRADREYALIDGAFRVHARGQGFDQWLRTHRTVELDGQRLSTWYWVTCHGRHEGHGVEHDHFENALRAIGLARQYTDFAAKRFDTLISDGFADFVVLINCLFALIRNECRAAVDADVQPGRASAEEKC
jgi:hypothetical protein